MYNKSLTRQGYDYHAKHNLFNDGRNIAGRVQQYICKTWHIDADRGGYTMRRSIKIELERRGYNVVVGKAISNRDWSDGGSDLEIETSRVPNQARYYVKVKERDEKFRPIWCALNGVWWWNFNVSIADQSTGKELMTWRGRGCADSSMRLLRRTLDKMERQNEQQ